MSAALIAAILVGSVFLFLVSGLYVGLGLAATGALALEFLMKKGSAIAVGATLGNSLNNFPLAAIPLFLLMGQIVLHSGLSRNLYRGVSKWMSIIPGGLLHSNIVSCAIFAAVSGSSPATAATIGTVAYPEQMERRYDSSMVTGSLAAGGTLGILIPPSIAMIVYGSFVGASVGRLFAGGIIPGITLTLLFMCYIAFAAVKNKSLAPPRERLTRRYFLEAIIAFKDVFPMLILIVVIMGSIYAGIMTPTEAAAVSVFVALIMGAIFGKISFAMLKESTLASLRTTSMVILVFVGAFILGAAVGLLRIPVVVSVAIAGLGLDPLWIWFSMVILYFVLGMFMDPMAAMLITLSVTYPLMIDLAGFDPIWFGVQLVVLCEIGMISPPVGLNLFVIHGIVAGYDGLEKASLGTIIRGIIPYVLIMLVALALFTWVPDMILVLPRFMIR